MMYESKQIINYEQNIIKNKKIWRKKSFKVMKELCLRSVLILNWAEKKWKKKKQHKNRKIKANHKKNICFYEKSMNHC